MMQEIDFPTAALHDLVQFKEPIPDRQMCIHTAPDNSATGYSFQLPNPLQELIYWTISPE